MSAVLLFGLLGIALVGIGLYRLVVSEGLLRRVVAVNVLAVGVASVLVASAYRGPDAPADAAPHAFVLTGIVVLVSTTAAALALIRRIHAEGGNAR
jgi:multicomponent Na+:H+ antiporter subunit C